MIYYILYTIYPIGSMYGIYANIWGILMGSMLPYIAAPWILWVLHYIYYCSHIGWAPQ